MKPTESRRALARSLEALRAAALAGDGVAACRLGDLHRQGLQVERDLKEAFRWYSLGAAHGDPYSQNNLGTMLLRGLGCAQDYAGAVMWYRNAAEQGHATAQANLARRLVRGEGVAPDMAEALRWFLAASRQGDLVSACEVGTMYRFGRGVAPDLATAARFHLLAARGGIVAAEIQLGDCLEALQDAALDGDQTVSRLLSEMHGLGLGVPQYPPLAWAWIRWAKEHCRPAVDEGEVTEVAEAFAFNEEWVSDAARAEGDRVVALLVTPLPGIPPARRRLPVAPPEDARSASGRKVE